MKIVFATSNPHKLKELKEIAEDLGMNQNSVNNLFKREDFPGLSITRPKQVCFLSYLIWKMERRV